MIPLRFHYIIGLVLVVSRTPDIPANIPRPNLIPFNEPYVEGGSMHPASRMKALQQVQQASTGNRKTSTSSKSEWSDRNEKVTVHVLVSDQRISCCYSLLCQFGQQGV